MPHRLRPLAPLWLLFAALACGLGPEPGEESARSSPEGWESLEGDEQAVRLYYQFVDAAGRVRFVERLDDVPEQRREAVGFVKLDVPPPLSPAAAAEARKAQLDRRGFVPVASGRISLHPVLYSAEWCGACRKAKDYLRKKRVAFVLRDVDEPAAALELRRKTGGQAIPVLDVGGRIVTGFSSRAYDALLDPP